MTDLEAIREAPVPRPNRLVQRFAKQISPRWGFALYGILYFVAVANTVGMMPVPLMMWTTSGPGPADSWKVFAWAVWYVVAQIVSWWLFSRWVKSRRAHATTVVRDGELVTGTVTTATGFTGHPVAAVVIRSAVVRPPISFGSDKQCTLLFLEGARWCFVFGPDGTAFACGIDGSNPIATLGKESNVDPLPQARIVE